ncbi:MAG TPA: zf-HC2 domain-containing protein [Blastocatellia bacterium]|jgi:hypothetical protein
MKMQHPDAKLFDYLGGRLDEENHRAVESHLASCGECAETAKIVGHIRELKPQTSIEHPDVNQLAEFFYSKSPSARHRMAAAHAAMCQSCADAISEYARAERAACEYDPASVKKAAVPESAWEMIREWEESDFARPKIENRESSQTMLVKLAEVLSHRKDELEQLAQEIRESGRFKHEETVSVIIIDKLARFRSVTLFEKTTTREGESLLKPVEESGRFDNKPFHVLLDFGEDNLVMVSDIVRHDTIRLQRITRANTSLKRADFFIVEE